MTAGKKTDRLQAALAEYAARFPGDSPARQAVHTVYGGAHLFRADSARKLGDLALRSLEAYAPDAKTFAAAVGLAPDLAATVYDRVVEKLRREPVEDFRIDFEDGYGNRPDVEEDATARSAAGEVAAGMVSGALPPFIGIRIKPLSRDLRDRALRTLELFLGALFEKTHGRLPANFVVTLPKIVVADQVKALVTAFEALERRHKLGCGTLRLELMVETPQSIVDGEGRCPLGAFVDAANGRCVAAHFGVYDYTASLNITAAQQRLRHPACDHARQVMQVALAGTGVWLSDGATTLMPVPRHRAPAGQSLTAPQVAENRESVFGGWRMHYDDVRHSLAAAYYQGWDLHPAQLPTRYAAVFGFFLEGLAAASLRLRRFVEQAAQATLVGDVFDDAATGQGLLNFFLRGLNSGAITEPEALATGLSLAELRTRSFLKILEGRRKSSRV